MTDEMLSILNEQFLNKRVTTKLQDRDQKGKRLDGKYVKVSGICQYIGPNKILNYDLQIVLNRMPIEVKHISEISVQPE